MITEAEVRSASRQVQDPELGRSIIDLGMVRDVGIPMLGLLENMSCFMCPDTGKHHGIFGSSDPELMASPLGMPFLGCLPIDPDIAALCEHGEIESYPGDLFDPIAKRIAGLAPAAVPPKTKKHEPQQA